MRRSLPLRLCLCLLVAGSAAAQKTGDFSGKGNFLGAGPAPNRAISTETRCVLPADDVDDLDDVSIGVSVMLRF